MKTYQKFGFSWILTIPFMLGSMASLQVSASTAPQTSASNVSANGANVSYRVSSDGRSIDIDTNSFVAGKSRLATCALSAPPSRARLSFDGLSLLVTSNGFIPVRAFRLCGRKPLLIRTVGETVGMLEDVSLNYGLYIGLLPVSTQPLAYLAVVGKFGSARNEVDLPGAYVDSQTDEQRQQHAFSYSDQTGPYAKISRDGVYVAPNGEFDCSRDAFPGIWNLATHQRLVFEGTPETIQASCKALFEKATRN